MGSTSRDGRGLVYRLETSTRTIDVVGVQLHCALVTELHFSVERFDFLLLKIYYLHSHKNRTGTYAGVSSLCTHQENLPLKRNE